MAEFTKNAEGFVGYEYKDVTVKRRMETVYADGYASFGWAVEGTALPLGGFDSVVLKFKRDRKIRNKAELGRLQRQFDSCVAEIESLEASKYTRAAVVAYTIGIIGAAFMAGSVFAFNAAMIPLFILLGIPGLIGFVLPYFLYVRVQRKRSEQVMPLIDQKYDEIYDVCEKGSALVNK